VAATRILVVEDEAIIARSLVTRLTRLDYEVVDVVEDGILAIETARKTLPDLVLMDIVLQGEIDGIEAAKQIWQKLKIPVVYLTAYTDANTLTRARQTSPFGYLLKPMWENNLHATLQMALQKAADERALLQDNQFLHQEVEHRVKNNLQVIASLLKLQSSKASSSLISEALQESQNRVLVMATAHRNAYPHHGLNQVLLQEYIDELVTTLLQSPKVIRDRIEYTRSIPVELANTHLTLEQAIPCGLIVNEVIANAICHGFEHGLRTGNIHFQLNRSINSHLALTIVNDGVPLSNSFNLEHSLRERQCIGLRLAELMCFQLAGQIQLQNKENLTVFNLTFPYSIVEA
jgi:two-component sensor histidine kinase